jgi:hypothetical protein
MTLATTNAVTTFGDARSPIEFHLPCAAATHFYEGRLIAQLLSGGWAVPYSTSSASMCVGVSEHEQDNTIGTAANGTLRIKCTSERIILLANGTSSDAFADTDQIGSVVFGVDDHTAAKTSSTQTRQAIGFFYGLDPDTGLVKVLISPSRARMYAALITALTDSTGGSTSSHSGALADVTATPTQALVNDNFAKVAAKLNAILAAIAP